MSAALTLQGQVPAKERVTPRTVDPAAPESQVDARTVRLLRSPRHGSGERCRASRCLREAACVYILASARNGTLYTGVTSDLVKRVWEHKNDLVEGFTKRYAVHTLVWFEVHEDMLAAIAREKAIKGWKRRWKLELIEAMNPNWRDLYPDLL